VGLNPQDPLALATNTFLFSKPTAQYNKTNFHGIPWVIIMGRSRKDPYSPTEEISGGEKKLFLIIVNVLGHPKRDRGLTYYFLRGGGMDVFWDDPRGYL
jgi:hypothetical protein